MARNSVSESDLGLTPTDDEMAAPQGEDISIADDPDPEQEPDPKPEPPAERTQMVDLRALQESRSELREANLQKALLASRLDEILADQQRRQQPEPAQPEAPEWMSDPIAAGNWDRQQVLDMQKRAQEQEFEARSAHEYSQTFDRVNTDFLHAAEADPQLPAAYEAVRNSIGQELLAVGYTLPEARMELAKIERGHIEHVARTGQDIGAYLKNLAVARGFQGQQQSPAQPPARSLNPGQIAQQQQRHQSLSDAPGGEVVPPVDAKSLAKMTDKQFKSWMATRGNDAKFQEIMGG